MAGNHDNAFSVVQDDSRFVHEAMASLGIFVDFSELSVDEMSLVLTVAANLKRAQGGAEVWEC